MANNLVATTDHLLDDKRIAFRNGRVHRHRCFDTEAFKNLEKTEEAHPRTVFARCVMAKVGIRRHHMARCPEGAFVRLHGKILERRYDQDGKFSALAPVDRWALEQVGPGIEIMVHAAATSGIFDIVFAKRHGSASFRIAGDIR